MGRLHPPGLRISNHHQRCRCCVMQHKLVSASSISERVLGCGAGAQAARQNEMAFFQTNPSYTGCNNIGTDFLSTKLSTQLIKAIQMQLPKITTSIDSGCSASVASLGPRVVQG